MKKVLLVLTLAIATIITGCDRISPGQMADIATPQVSPEPLVVCDISTNNALRIIDVLNETTEDAEYLTAALKGKLGLQHHVIDQMGKQKAYWEPLRVGAETFSRTAARLSDVILSSDPDTYNIASLNALKYAVSGLESQVYALESAAKGLGSYKRHFHWDDIVVSRSVQQHTDDLSEAVDWMEDTFSELEFFLVTEGHDNTTTKTILLSDFQKATAEFYENANDLSVAISEAADAH